MSGIYGVIDLDNKLPNKKGIFNFFFSSGFENTINEELMLKKMAFGRSMPDKMMKDKVFFRDDDFIIILDGFIKAEGNPVDFIISEYMRWGGDFVEQLDGCFSLCLLDMKKEKIVLANDHLSTKPLYYSYNKNGRYFVFSSELKVISKLFKSNDIKFDLDIDAVYSIVSLGYVVEDKTYLDKVKRLRPSSTLSLSIKEFDIDVQVKSLERRVDNSIGYKDAVNKMSDLLIDSLRNGIERNKKYNGRMISLLSGGLDSRWNVLFPIKEGVEKITTLTFSESNTLDESIAKDICFKSKAENIFRSLDNGVYLEDDLYDLVSANDGMVSLAGASHLFTSLRKINLKDFEFIFSGQIGDAVFGSYSGRELTKSKITYNDIAFDNSSYMNSYLENLEQDSYLYCLKTKTPNSATNGDIVSSHIIDSFSPFYSKSLIEYSLRLPDKYMASQRIYFDVMKNIMPEMLEYKWEKTGWYPNNLFVNKVLSKYKHYRNGILNRLGLLGKKDMNPFVYWLKNNKRLINKWDLVFRENIDLIKDEKLKNVLKGQYKKRPRDKMIVLTILIAVRIHFVGVRS